MVLTLTEDIIIQSEPKKQDENQILEKKFYKVSDFELKFSKAAYFETKFPQGVGYGFQSFTTRTILD